MLHLYRHFLKVTVLWSETDICLQQFFKERAIPSCYLTKYQLSGKKVKFWCKQPMTFYSNMLSCPGVCVIKIDMVRLTQGSAVGETVKFVLKYTKRSYNHAKIPWFLNNWEFILIQTQKIFLYTIFCPLTSFF